VEEEGRAVAFGRLQFDLDPFLEEMLMKYMLER
jgi:hypothetical protein